MHLLFRHRLLRAAVSLGFILGFLGCLVAQETTYSQAATSESLVVTSKAVTGASGATPSFCGSRFAVVAGSTYQGDALRFNCSDSMLTEPLEIGLPDEFGVALEDEGSIEMSRIDIQQRTFGIDRIVIGSKVASKAARNTRPNISTPLLV